MQPSQDPQDKRTVKNALAPTRIAYVGGQAEFTVDMGLEVCFFMQRLIMNPLNDFNYSMQHA